jgi:transposase
LGYDEQGTPDHHRIPYSLTKTSARGARGEKAPTAQALYLVASGQAPTRLALAQLLAVHRHTIRAWLALYEAGGLDTLLTIHKAPGRVSRLTASMQEKLHARLQEPQGFASYGAIQQYLAQDHHLSLSYSAVHALVRYKLGAKPKAPRRSHPKKILPLSHTFNRPSRSTF